MGDLEAQLSEVEVLKSIYSCEEELCVYNDSSGMICIQFYAFLDLPENFSLIFNDDRSQKGISSQDKDTKQQLYSVVSVEHLPPIELTAVLPSNYPSVSAPKFHLSCPWLSIEMLMRLCKRLDGIWDENKNFEILYLWTRFLKVDALPFLNIEHVLEINFSCFKQKKLAFKSDGNFNNCNTDFSATLIASTSDNGERVKEKFDEAICDNGNDRMFNGKTRSDGDFINGNSATYDCNDDVKESTSKSTENCINLETQNKESCTPEMTSTSCVTEISEKFMKLMDCDKQQSCINGIRPVIRRDNNRRDVKIFRERLFYNSKRSGGEQFPFHKNKSKTSSGSTSRCNNDWYMPVAAAATTSRYKYDKYGSCISYSASDNLSSGTSTNTKVSNQNRLSPFAVPFVSSVSSTIQHHDDLPFCCDNSNSDCSIEKHKKNFKDCICRCDTCNNNNFNTRSNIGHRARNQRKKNSLAVYRGHGRKSSCKNEMCRFSQKQVNCGNSNDMPIGESLNEIYSKSAYNSNLNVELSQNLVDKKNNGLTLTGGCCDESDLSKFSAGVTDTNKNLKVSLDKLNTANVPVTLSAAKLLNAGGKTDNQTTAIQSSVCSDNKHHDSDDKYVIKGDQSKGEKKIESEVVGPSLPAAATVSCDDGDNNLLLVVKVEGKIDERIGKCTLQYCLENFITFLEEYNEDKILSEFRKAYFHCSICFEMKLGLYCIKLKPCGHVFCKDCVGKFILGKINDGSVFVIKCPEENCTSDITPSQVRDVVGPEQFNKYDSLLLTTTLQTMTDITLCPRSACQYPVTREPDEKMAACPSCNYVFCVFCRMVYHGVEACRFKSDEIAALVKRYMEGSDEEKHSMELRYGRKQLVSLMQASLSESWIVNNSQNCPHCNASIEKNGGCNKMVCWRCSTYFCWICKSQLDPTCPYFHYNDRNSKCYKQLFQGGNISDDEDEFDGNDDGNFIIFQDENEQFFAAAAAAAAAAID